MTKHTYQIGRCISNADCLIRIDPVDSEKTYEELDIAKKDADDLAKKSNGQQHVVIENLNMQKIKKIIYCAN